MGRSETERINAVKRFEKFDFDLNTNFNGLLQLAADIYETPAAFITLIDENDQWFKVNRGFDIQCMPRNISFCTHTIMQDNAMVVNDAQNDERFDMNPFVNNAPNVRFYAGASLSTHDGNNIGTLCVMDVRPKDMPESKKQLLEILAKQAIYLMELDLTYKLLNEKMGQIALQNTSLLEIAFIQSHEFRGPVTTIMGLMNIIKEDGYQDPKQYLLMLEQAVAKLDEKIHIVVESTAMAKAAYVG